jgi:hypothetical protein
MDHTTFNSTSLHDFLGCFECLKRLEYNLDYDSEVGDEEMIHYELVPPRVSQAMAHLSDSLEDLSYTTKVSGCDRRSCCKSTS